MWKKLGIDLDKHDQLLNVLPNIFDEIYIKSQKNRPNMTFFDSVVKDIHGIRIKELLEEKEKGKKIIGTFCVYVPDEIIFSLDCIGVGLCGGTDFSQYAVEGILPANLCPLIKSSVGFKLGKICPYFECLDLLIGETTCDGKKKVWEILSEYTNMYVMEIPQCKDRKQAKEHFLREIKDLVKKLETISGNKLSFEKLKKWMEIIEQEREQLRRIYNSRENDPPPISGKDALLVSQITFYDDPLRQIQVLKNLADELDERIKNKVGVVEKGTPRILISGTPMAIPNWKLHHIVETNGAVVVAEETCTGTRYFSSKLKIQGNTIEDLLNCIADRYLNINCACFTPNEARIEDIKHLIKEYKIDGVILYNLSFCQPYEIEAFKIQNKLKDENIPVLIISTDYSSDDIAQLKTRVEAFIELIKNNK